MLGQCRVRGCDDGCINYLWVGGVGNILGVMATYAMVLSLFVGWER